MRIFRLFAAVAAGISAWPATADETGSYALAGFSVSVNWTDAACQLRLSRGDTVATYQLPLQTPCALHVKADGGPRTMERADGLFFLVESSKPMEGSADCDTRIQAVRLDAFGADLAPVVERVAACLPMAWDDAVFLSMFPVK